MRFLKKFMAALTCLALSASLSSCADTRWGAQIEDYQLSAGLFILGQMGALSEVYAYMTENEYAEDASPLDVTIEGKSAEEWINDKATETLKEYVAVEKKFNEVGLIFEDSEFKNAALYVDSMWESYEAYGLGDYYSKVGVGKQSQTDQQVNLLKKDKLFEYYYGEGGEKEITKDEIDKYISENYAKVSYIEMPLKDGEGNLLKTDGKAEIKRMAQDYIARAEGGESFDTISTEYNKYYNGLLRDAAIASGEFTEETYDAQNVQEESYPPKEATVKKGDSYPSAVFAEKLFDGSVADGGYALIEEDEIYYIVYKPNILEDTEYVAGMKSSVQFELKGEEFEQSIKDWSAGLTVVKNDAAYKRYSIEKLIEE